MTGTPQTPVGDDEPLDAFLARLEAEGTGSAGSYTPRPPQRAAGTLRAVIKAAKRATGENLADLTVLSAAVDPYRLDTPAGHRIGQWFAEQVERFVPGDGTIHLRGLHYRISSMAQ